MSRTNAAKRAAEVTAEHDAWRKRLEATTQKLKDNPHRTRRDAGHDGHFRHGLFISGVDRKALDTAFEE